MMRKEDPDIPMTEKLKIFGIVHWRGEVALATPLIAIVLLIPLPPEKFQWCGYCLVVMAIYWATECIPLPITSFLPVIVFPLTGVLSTRETCKAYITDALVMFFASIMLAYSVEQSGLHKRLAYCAIRLIGYSHYRLLAAMCLVTMFASMWLTNTAAATMMVPINFAILTVFQGYKLLKIYDIGPDGENVASDITVCYFCAATYSSTIGGVGTLVGTATNLALKGLYMKAYPDAPEYLSFPRFSAFTIPLVILNMITMYVYMTIVFFGFLRPNSKAAKSSRLTPEGKKAAQKAVKEDYAKLGPVSCWEIMVIILFGGAMVMFFFRSPQILPGWGDAIEEHYYLDSKFVQDSALATLVLFLMVLFPANDSFFLNFKAKYQEDLTKTPVQSVLDWRSMMASMPFSFAFLLGGGIALSTAAKESGLNDRIGDFLKSAENLDDLGLLLIIILIVVCITNIASNVAVVNVLSPIAMHLASQTGKNPLWYTIASGVSASFGFCLPVGSPGNLIVKSAANIPTSKMIVAGIGPTISVIISTWLLTYWYAPVVWSDA